MDFGFSRFTTLNRELQYELYQELSQDDDRSGYADLGDGANTVELYSYRNAPDYFINAQGGDDFVRTGYGDDTIYGGSGTDEIWTTGGNDTVYAGSGNDKVQAGEGDDTLSGGSGRDTLYGDDGDDRLSGGSGDDTLIADSGTTGHGHDTLSGGHGVDSLFGGAYGDVLTGGADKDTFRYTGATSYQGATATTSGGFVNESPLNDRDHITDYSFGDGDVIDLSAIDWNRSQAGDQRLDFETALAAPARASRTGRARLKLIGLLDGETVVAAVVSPLGTEGLSLVSLRRADRRERKAYDDHRA